MIATVRIMHLSVMYEQKVSDPHVPQPSSRLVWVILGRGRCQVNHPLAATERIRDTIVHEMCHAANWIIDGTKRAGHGKLWKAW